MLAPLFNLRKTCILFLTLSVMTALPALALDTDIYQANVKHNAYIMLDNSGSMDYGVYESNVDYGAMYDYLYSNEDIGDTVSDAATGWYERHNDRKKIYLVKGKISAQIINIDDTDQVFTGDAADPEYVWQSGDMVDTHTVIDNLGNLSSDGGTQRITVDNDGYILLDGVQLPLGQNIQSKDYKTLFDGSIINEGFGGLLNAPGYYFSGLEGVTAGSHNQVEDNEEDIYFFITGNWMNMQQMYNLHYTSNPGSYAATGDAAWKHEEFPLAAEDWSTTEYLLDYPEGSNNYANNLSETDTIRSITHSGAEKIQIHFNLFDVEGDDNSNKFSYDYVALYDSEGTLVAQYDNDNSPQGNWSPIINGDTVYIKLKSDPYVVEQGYTIDQYRTTYGTAGGDTGSYLMQNRLDVAKDALLYVIDEFRGKINWGFASFNYQGTTANGATIHSALNPNDTDDANRAAIANHVENVEPLYGTPLGEALQDIYDDGYYGHRNSLDNLLCRKNYAIVVSDGFPSGDNDWSRINDVTFSDFDGDKFTADPYQYDNPPPNYYDDVAHWIYTHSWLDGSLITDPANSYQNIIPHQISFGAKHPLMRNAAQESGAEYITAYNKTQLVNAFHSLGMMISQAVSFTAPVVSVDAANRIQHGNDLYMGLFLPMDSEYWPGNIKHFQLGDGSDDRPDKWQIYDADSNAATTTAGAFLDNLDGYWGDDLDVNDTDTNGGADIKEDGVGEVLSEQIQANFLSNNFYDRTIKTWIDDADSSTNNLVEFTPANITTAILGLGDSEIQTRNKIINYVYGYTFDADEVTGNPIAAREWALGSIIHSSPTIIDYYDESDNSIVAKRYIAVGANDGIFHIFNDANGEEIFAFVPDDVLPKFAAFETEFQQSMVDGDIKLIRENGHPKYIIFGLRRGGSSYWRIDISDRDHPANWSVDKFSDSEMGQSWSEIKFARIRTGADSFTTVAIFSGGYDPIEDDFPEPFSDADNSGSPFRANGTIDNGEWKASTSGQDPNNNGAYDIFNPDGDDRGRAIYVVDIRTLTILFSVKYSNTDLPSTPGSFNAATSQTRSDFNYCFPATPSVVTRTIRYDDAITATRNNILAAIYAPDIYGNMFRIIYDYNDTDGDGIGSPLWQVKKVFSTNPGSVSGSGELWGDASDDLGRKVFYGPAVSWTGTKNYFDQANYRYPATEFHGTDIIASLFFGTGDREHPTYKIARNRFYAVYDDSTVSASTTAGEINVSSSPYTESDLLNISCDELGIHTTQADGSTYAYKTALETLLLDDVTNPDSSAPMELNSGNGENDAKGWYIILDQQGDGTYCNHCTYEATVDTSEGGRDDHVGEKILSKPLLFLGSVYFTAYQPSFSDPCAPLGNAFFYALNYLNGAAALNLNYENDDPDDDDPFKKDVTDRYGKYSGISGIPSSPILISRDGETGIFMNIGDRIIRITPKDGSLIDLYYWIER